MAEQAQKSGAEDTQLREPNDYQRLLEQAAMWRRASEQVLDRVDLQPGMSCLDVGTGAGAVMRLMAERVGPEGQVTGIDLDGALGRKALAELRATGGAKFDLISADVGTLEDVPGAPFDLTYSRMFLMHMPDPVAVLEQMLHWTKSGGVVAAQELDFGSLVVEPRCPPMTEFNRLFEGVFRGHGRNLRAGRQLPAQFEAAGLGTPDGTNAEAKFLPLKDIGQMVIGVYQQLFAEAAPLGLADPVRAEAFKVEMTEAAATIVLRRSSSAPGSA